MSRSTYLILAVMSIIVGTGINYSLATTSQTSGVRSHSTGYTGYTGHGGSFLGGHK